MWIVRLALRRPYTFVVVSLLIVILGVSAIVTMPTDIFPYIDIPVVSVVWTYSGLSPEEMEKRIVTISERAMTTTVNDIEHIESQSYTGVAVIRVFFQPNAKVELALAQVTAIVADDPARRCRRASLPPTIVKYDASSVPILQLGLASEGSERAGALRLRHRTSSAPSWRPCRARPFRCPTAASRAQIMVDLDPDQLYAKHLSAHRRLERAQPAEPDPARRHRQDRRPRIPGPPEQQPDHGRSDLNDLPISDRQRRHRLREGRGAGARRLSRCRPTSCAPNGTRAALLTVLKNGKASTLDIVKAVKDALPAHSRQRCRRT